MANSEFGSKFFIGLVKPCQGIILSPKYKKNISNHGPFELYVDLLEVDEDSIILVLAALRENDIVKLSPQKATQKGTADGVVILSHVFATNAEKQQLKITIDRDFVKRMLKSTTFTLRNFRINFEALDWRNINFCYLNIDDINNIKSVGTQGKKQDVNIKSEKFKFEVPGEKIDFLKVYDEEMQQKFRNELKMSGQSPQLLFYDAAGHKHFLHDDTLQKKKENDSRQWWNRLSEAKVREVVVQASTLVQDVLTDESLPEAVSKFEETQ